MTHPLAAEARRLRSEEELSARQIRERLGIGKELLQELLRGVPPPEWTRRPNAKDELRARALELRGQGRSVNAIADELGVSKSTAYLWVRHLPFDKDPSPPTRWRLAAGGRTGSALTWASCAVRRSSGTSQRQIATTQVRTTTVVLLSPCRAAGGSMSARRA
jgi:hypothetical protein